MTDKGMPIEPRRVVSVALPKADLDRLEEFRWKRRLSRSRVIVEAVRSYLVKHGQA